jgi:hypothetical protein
MSTMNALKGRMNSAAVALGPYKEQIQLGLYVLLGLLVVYAVFTALNPPPDQYEQVLLSDLRKGTELNGTQIKINPPMVSGGEYTFQTWIYISNYDYRALQPKHVFTISTGQQGLANMQYSQAAPPSRQHAYANVYLDEANYLFGAVRSELEELEKAAMSNDTIATAVNEVGGVVNSVENAAGRLALNVAKDAACIVAVNALDDAKVAKTADVQDKAEKCLSAQTTAASSCGLPPPDARVNRAPHVTMTGVLYPAENKMMIRVYQAPPSSVEGFQSGGTPGGTFQTEDITLMSNFTKLFSGKLTGNTLNGTLDYPLCDIQNLPLQKWICLTIVMNGRVMDVYQDGKLARSCVLPGVPIVEKGDNYVTLGLQGGWAGSVSTTRFYGYALTPGRVYDLYSQGPAVTRGLDTKYGYLGWLYERLGFHIKYSGL